MARRGTALAAAALSLLATACGGTARQDPDPCARSTPGAPWLVYATRGSGSYDLAVIRADGSCRALVTSGDSDDLYPSWSIHDRIAFASDRGGALGIWIHDVSTGADTALSVGDLAATSPAFSPEGTKIAFEGRAPGALQTDVYVVAAAGGTPVQLTTSTSNDAGPAWSPDGLTVYFVSTRTGRYEIFSVPAAGGEAAQVTTSSRVIGRPIVAPAGDALYYARTVSGSAATEVVRFDLATSAITVVSSQDDSEPALDPSGERLALRSFRLGSADLFLVDAADGANPLPLTDDAASDGAPAFAPAP